MIPPSSRSGRRRFAVPAVALWAALCVVLAACGQVPQPFRPPDGSKRHNAFLIVPEAVGVTVRRIEGPVPWVGEALAEHMADALRKNAVPASARAANRASYVLESDGFQQLHGDRPPELVMSWRLSGPDGRRLGEHVSKVTPPDGFWDAPEPRMFDAIAAEAAPTVASWVLPRIEAEPSAALPAVALGPIEGAPGDGATALSRALTAILKRDSVEVLESPDETAVVVSADVEVRPVGGDLDRVSIVWRVADAAGRQIGTIGQENTVETGRLETRWGAVAFAAADGAASGVKDLLRQLRDLRGRQAAERTR